MPAPILIYDRILEIDNKVFTVCHFPGTLEQLTLAHPNHQIYLYEPPIESMPETVLDEDGNPQIGEIPAPIHPETWTPVDPVVAIVLPIIST
jgi:hypothetical protein